MSKGRELSDYLDDIITAITDTAEFTQGMSYEMFAADKKTVNAVIRCLEKHSYFPYPCGGYHENFNYYWMGTVYL